MKSAGILLLLIGKHYGVRLAACLWSLRQFNRQPVCILCGDDLAEEQVKLFMADDRMHPLSTRRFEHVRRRNAAYQLKATTMWRLSPFDVTVFFDADTIFTGKPFDELWPKDPREVVLTPFGCWVNTGNIVSGRIRRWEVVDAKLVEQALVPTKPAINTGVMGWTKQSQLLPVWSELCLKQEATEGRIQFIADEVAMQLIFDTGAHRLLDGRYNRSPKYGGCREEDAVIHHLHGKNHVRGRGAMLMRDAIRNAWDANVANIQSWGRQSDPDTMRLLDA